MQPLITVFTPIYNRARLIKELYDSLCLQTFNEFEWIIVDDGSTDNIKGVIEEYCMENKINIRYYRQANGGKHRAINHGVRKAVGELFLILDSDDILPKNSLENISRCYKDIENDSSFAGICGLMAHRNGELISKIPALKKEYIDDNEINFRYKYNITGDLCEVFKTSVMKEFPFPEFDKEKFCPEQLVWFRIARKYKLHLIPIIIYYRDYLDGGLTSKIVRIRKENPKGTLMTYAEMLSLDIPFMDKIKAFLNYCRFYILSKI